MDARENGALLMQLVHVGEALGKLGQVLEGREEEVVVAAVIVVVAVAIVVAVVVIVLVSVDVVMIIIVVVCIFRLFLFRSIFANNSF